TTSGQPTPLAQEWFLVTRLAAALTLIPLIALTGCAAASSAKSEPDTASSHLSFDELPDCGLVSAQAKELVGDFVPSPDGLEDAFVNDESASLSCTWVTPQTVSGDATELAKFGGLAIGVDIEKVPSTRADLKLAGLLQEYGPADEVGASVSSLNKDFDPAAGLEGLGITVHRANVSIVVTAIGLYLDSSNIVGHRTNAAAIEAALRIHEAM